MIRRMVIGLVTLWALGVIGCLVGGLLDYTALLPAWLCGYLLWLGVPLGAVTLVLVHDLSGGEWMSTAQPAVRAAAATMPVATLAGLLVLLGVTAVYGWASDDHLSNAFYLNAAGFDARFGFYVVVWTLLAAYALFAPGPGGRAVAPGVSWISGLSLVVMALSTGFASIDWSLSLEPKFWSSIFPYTMGASWFNTGMAVILFVVVAVGPDGPSYRDPMADLARILFATMIFWVYVEFIQFLIIWQSNLKYEIPWYVKRLHSPWTPVMYFDVLVGFAAPCFMLLWSQPKRHRGWMALVCAFVILSRIAHGWVLVLPEFRARTRFWLDVAAL